MRFEFIIVGAAAIFLAYAYFNDASSVEMMWEKFLQHWDAFVQQMASGTLAK
jgi:hypothetical protein